MAAVSDGEAEGRGAEGRWTIREVLAWTATRFARSDDRTGARLDAEVLLAHCLAVDRLRLYVDFDKPLAAEELAAYREVVRRRLEGEPVAYITGHREFWSLDFAVSRAVLTPRPETELLVEVALDYLRAGDRVGRHESTVVDVGTGSGAVAISLAHEYPSLEVHAIDSSAEALEVARDNASRIGVEVTFHQGDLLDGLPEDRAAGCDIVLANLPYIPTGELSTLMVDVRRFEPRAALDGGADGLDLIRRLIPQAAARIRPEGLIALEISPEQWPATESLLLDGGFVGPAARRDLAGLDRVVLAHQGPRR